MLISLACCRGVFVNFYSFLVRMELWRNTIGGYRWVFALLLYAFVSVRCPCVYGIRLFIGFCLVWVLGVFFTTLVSRIPSVTHFFATFIPLGVSPILGIWLSVLEFASFLSRPVVLFLRPVVNLTFGYYLAELCVIKCCVWLAPYYPIEAGLVSRIVTASWWLPICLLVMLYEWWVSFVQWYIIKQVTSVGSNAY